MRKTIAVDIDDVLSASAEGFAAFSNSRWGTNLTAADYSEEWAVVWGIPLEEAKKRAVEFHDANAVADYRHHAQSLPVLRKLRERYNLVIVTSRRNVLKPATDTWLQTFFPDIFSGVHYAGMWDAGHDPLHALKQTKAGVCQAIGADYLIDDQLKHCLAAAECGLKVLLFGTYKWNQTEKTLPQNVTRAADWAAVERYFGDVES
jgi:uncharacterized HAD superfamily protein